MLFDGLKVWRDEQERSGPENMALDESLMQSLGDEAILRIYKWAGDWVSLGYFQSLADAQRLFGPEPKYVRRWTGGGVVDHRRDFTYTLAIPRGHELAGKRGNESYCAIHREIAKCLGQGGIACGLTELDSSNESSACFEKPVAWDLVDEGGGKLAGAGQRRSRWGILHQGSVQVHDAAMDGLAEVLGGACSAMDPESVEGWEKLVPKYAAEDWLTRIS